jgi:hypothetical protein
MKMSAHACGLVTTTIAAALLVTMAQPGFGEGVKYKPISVQTPDGLTISAQEWGNPAGPEILFIHGFSQSHLSWMRQIEGDLAKEFHIVTTICAATAIPTSRSMPRATGIPRLGATRCRP